MSNVLAIAHRAGNSLAGLHAANELGVDVIECDVHHFRGRLEVRHYKSLGALAFLWSRWELTSSMASRLGLTELLEADRHGAMFMIDLKGRQPRAARLVAELLHEGGHHRPVLVCGRWWPAVERVAELPYVLPVLSARSRGQLARLRQRVIDGPPVHGVSVHRALLDAPTVAELLESVEVVMTWPVNDVRALDQVLAMGVNGVTSDEAKILARLMARRQAS